MRKKVKSLSDYPEVTGWSVGTEAIRERPEHAKLIMEMIAAVANIGRCRGQILSEMTHAHARYTMMMFESIPTQSSQKSVLRKVATEALSVRDCALLKKIEKKSEGVQNIRNEFSHSDWGHTDQLPNCIIRIPSNRLSDSVFDDGGGVFPLRGWVDRKHIEVYSDVDLKDIASCANLTASAYANFLFLLCEERLQESLSKVAGKTSSVRIDRAMENIEKYLGD